MQQIASDRTNACQGIYPLFKTMSESTHVPTPIKVSKLQIDKCSSIWEFHQNTGLNIVIMKDPKLRISTLTYIFVWIRVSKLYIDQTSYKLKR